MKKFTKNRASRGPISRIAAKRKKRASAVDLFCGAGGLTHGLISTGLRVNAGIDIDADCKFPFERNNKSTFIDTDIKKITAKQLKKLYPTGDVKILVGCAPCQPFSKYTQGRENRRDAKWRLLDEFSRLIKQVRPEVISMENVRELMKHSVYRDFVRNLKQLGYKVSAHEVFCPEYGIPQRRTRLVLLASLLGAIEIIPKTHLPGQYLTVRDAIKHLPRIAAGATSKKDPLHSCSTLSPKNLKRIRASRQGGTWRDWNPNLVAKCHRKKKGKTFPSVYGRMEWDKSAPTITTQFFGFGNGRFGHPTQDRAISLREGAILQSFPENYAFIAPKDPITFKKIGRLIGNAVPVRLGAVVGETIKRHLEQYGIKV